MEQTLRVTKVVITAKPMKYGYKALGKQSNLMMLSREENLARLKNLLGLKVCELRAGN